MADLSGVFCIGQCNYVKSTYIVRFSDDTSVRVLWEFGTQLEFRGTVSDIEFQDRVGILLPTRQPSGTIFPDFKVSRTFSFPILQTTTILGPTTPIH